MTTIQHIQEKLKELGTDSQIVELSQSTRTAQEAASAVECEVGQIAKSIIFRCKNTNKPVLVVASGKNRINEEKISLILGEQIEKADADFVYEHTGVAIGGIPPVCHKTKIKTFIDKGLLDYKEIWAAAGTPHAIFKIDPNDLVRIIDGEVVAVV